MTKDELIQIVKDEDPSLLGSDFIADICAMHCDKSTEDEVIEFDDKILSLCEDSKFK